MVLLEKNPAMVLVPAFQLSEWLALQTHPETPHSACISWLSRGLFLHNIGIALLALSPQPSHIRLLVGSRRVGGAGGSSTPPLEASDSSRSTSSSMASSSSVSPPRWVSVASWLGALA